MIQKPCCQVFFIKKTKIFHGICREPRLKRISDGEKRGLSGRYGSAATFRLITAFEKPVLRAGGIQQHFHHSRTHLPRIEKGAGRIDFQLTQRRVEMENFIFQTGGDLHDGSEIPAPQAIHAGGIENQSVALLFAQLFDLPLKQRMTVGRRRSVDHQFGQPQSPDRLQINLIKHGMRGFLRRVKSNPAASR